MKKIVFILMLLMLFSNSTNGQDMQFTQFYSSPLYLNPAFTGAGACSRVSLAYRNQWPGVKKGYVSKLASFDHFLPQEKIGLGLLFADDVAGSGSLKRTTISALIAYKTNVSRRLAIRFGFQPGMGFLSINHSALIFGDQIARGGNVPTIELPTRGKTYFDIGAGILGYSKNLWVGASVYHFIKLEEGLVHPYAKLPLKLSAHGGYKFLLKEDLKYENNDEFLSVAFNYRHQEMFDQLDIGAYYTKGIFNVGLWYRGIPFLKSYQTGYSNNDAIAILVGLKAERINIGYSYDITISKLSMASFGAHEITLGAQFCNPNKKVKKRWPVPCPKF